MQQPNRVAHDESVSNAPQAGPQSGHLWQTEICASTPIRFPIPGFVEDHRPCSEPPSFVSGFEVVRGEGPAAAYSPTRPETSSRTDVEWLPTA